MSRYVAHAADLIDHAAEEAFELSQVLGPHCENGDGCGECAGCRAAMRADDYPDGIPW